MTITVSPGRTSAELTAEPQPVPTPQPTRHALSSGRSLSILMVESTLATGVLREGRDAAHLADGLAVQAHPEAAGVVGASAGQQAGPQVAEVLHAGGAPAALAAAGQEGEHDVVAHLVALGARPDLLDDAGSLVPPQNG
jgi:hypothetical protein